MKTNDSNAQHVSEVAKTLSDARARARAEMEQKQTRASSMSRARFAARDMETCAPLAGRGALMVPPAAVSSALSGDDLRALRAGILTGREVETMREDDARAEIAAAEERELTKRRAQVARWNELDQHAHVARWEAYTATAGAISRLRARAAEGDPLVKIDKATGHLVLDVREDAEGKRVADSSAPFGAWVVDVHRQRMERLARIAAGSIGEGWHTVRAEDAGELLAAETARQVRAAAGSLLRLGLRGRVSARAARLGMSSGKRWLRRNSRREALALREIGGAAGVDDLGAGAQWARELVAISGAVHQRAAAIGCRLLERAARLRAGHRPGGVSRGWQWAADLAAMGEREARDFLFARGRRVDGAPVVEWTAEGRTVREDSIGITGRGAAWVWAAKQAGREMHRARYGMGGRDGREVAAGWGTTGDVSSDDFASVPDGAEVWPARRTPTRRPSSVSAIRDALAHEIREARAAVEDARAAAMAAVTPAARIAAGSALGAARRSVCQRVERARVLGRAMRGADVDGDRLAALVESSDKGERLSDAGRQWAKRVRDALRRDFPALVATASEAAKV